MRNHSMGFSEDVRVLLSEFNDLCLLEPKKSTTCSYVIKKKDLYTCALPRSSS